MAGLPAGNVYSSMNELPENHIITSGMARKLGLKRYNSGKPCLRGHVAPRYVSNGRCVKCQADDQCKRKHVGSSHSESSNPVSSSDYDSGYRDGFLDGLIEVFDLVKNAADVREIRAGMFNKIASVKEMYDERSE